MTTTKNAQGFTSFEPFPESSVIANAWHDEVDRKLFIEFVESGTIAGYAGVDSVAFYRMLAAESVGSHWNRNIKNHFSGINGNVELFERVRKPVDQTINVGQSSNTVETVFNSYGNTQASTINVEYQWEVVVKVRAATLQDALSSLSQGTVVAVNQVR